MIVLCAHEEDVLFIVGLNLHVGSVSLEELDHLCVAVEGGEMKGC